MEKFSTLLVLVNRSPNSPHYNDVMMSAIASQITSLTIVYSTVYSDADQRKHQSSASLAFVWGIHRRPVNSPHKWPVTRKKFPFDDVIILTPTKWPPYAIPLNENFWFSYEMLLRCVPYGWIDNKPPLVEIMAWRCTGDKLYVNQWWPSLLTHISITRPH